MKLQFNQINKYFDDFHVLQDISFEVSAGQIFGFLGRNGAGKTTAIRILMDVFRQDSGKILLDNKEFSVNDYTIGYLPEERGMYGQSTVKDQLVYFAMLRGASRNNAKKSVEYWTKRFEIDHYLDRKLETLSKGNQQKVQITQAFLNEPDILILDEPFSGLDPVNASLFQEALSDYISNDKIIMFSSHQMSYVESFCDDIAIIDHGRIILNGNLDKIKEEISNNRRLISSGDKHIVECFDKFGVDYTLDKDEYIVSVINNKEGNKLLNRLLNEEIEINKYEPYRPSLHEIFVSKVGEVK